MANKVIGRHLRRLRQRAGISQHELALRCRFTQSHISKLEQGERSLFFSEVFLYAEALGISADELLNGIRHAMFDHLRNQRDCW
ncbi:MAG: helix-turn-helix transcriptional regulator [Coriobacteriales bacterium]|nr:helix-turn-helix transcriptional regulator [Coriobacteriales bacterium]